MIGAAAATPVTPAHNPGASRSPFWLRAASIVAALFAAGHTLGGRRAWSPVFSPALEAMRTSAFHVEGVSRTYYDFYRGFGFSLSVFMLLQALVLWQLSGIAKANPSAARPIAGAFGAASLALTAIAWAFIMPVPAIFSAVLTACIGAAFFAC